MVYIFRTGDAVDSKIKNLIQSAKKKYTEAKTVEKYSKGTGGGPPKPVPNPKYTPAEIIIVEIYEHTPIFQGAEGGVQSEKLPDPEKYKYKRNKKCPSISPSSDSSVRISPQSSPNLSLPSPKSPSPSPRLSRFFGGASASYFTQDEDVVTSRPNPYYRHSGSASYSPDRVNSRQKVGSSRSSIPMTSSVRESAEFNPEEYPGFTTPPKRNPAVQQTVAPASMGEVINKINEAPRQQPMNTTTGEAEEEPILITLVRELGVLIKSINDNNLVDKFGQCLSKYLDNK